MRNPGFEGVAVEVATGSVVAKPESVPHYPWAPAVPNDVPKSPMLESTLVPDSLGPEFCDPSLSVGTIVDVDEERLKGLEIAGARCVSLSSMERLERGLETFKREREHQGFRLLVIFQDMLRGIYEREAQ